MAIEIVIDAIKVRALAAGFPGDVQFKSDVGGDVDASHKLNFDKDTSQLIISDDNPTTPCDPSAMIEMRSDTKGFLPPRMSMVDRDAIADPAEGLLIWSLGDLEYQFWDGSVWQSIAGGVGSAIFHAETFVSSPAQTLFNLTLSPVAPSTLQMFVNGTQATPIEDFSVSGSQVTWLDSGFQLESGDGVVIIYQ